MGKAHKLRDILHAIACSHTGAKTGRTDIDRIGSVANGFNAALQVTGGGKELYEFTI